MATLRKAVFLAVAHSRVCNQLSRRQISSSKAVLGNYWNHEWKPGPIPRTPEERAAAAKKYGMRPEDYKILADESDDRNGQTVHFHLGDYPNIQTSNYDLRDPWEDYDFPQERRNYGEPIEHEYDMPGSVWDDPNTKPQFGLSQGEVMFRFVSILIGFWGLFFLLQPYPMIPPMMPKQYPFNQLHVELGGDPKDEPEIVHYKI